MGTAPGWACPQIRALRLLVSGREAAAATAPRTAHVRGHREKAHDAAPAAPGRAAPPWSRRPHRAAPARTKISTLFTACSAIDASSPPVSHTTAEAASPNANR